MAILPEQMKLVVRKKEVQDWTGAETGTFKNGLLPFLNKTKTETNRLIDQILGASSSLNW
jgi:hypothetical protein